MMKKSILFHLIGILIPGIVMAVPMQALDNETAAKEETSLIEVDQFDEQHNNLDALNFSQDKSKKIPQPSKSNRFLDDLKKDNELDKMEIELLKSHLKYSGQEKKNKTTSKQDDDSSGTGLYFLVEPIAEEIAQDPEMKNKAKKILEMTKGARDYFTPNQESNEVINISEQVKSENVELNKKDTEFFYNQSQSSVKNDSFTDYDEEQIFQKIKWGVIYTILALIVIKFLMVLFRLLTKDKKKYSRRQRQN